MDCMMLSLIIQILYFQAYCVVGSDSDWQVKVPTSVAGLESSCVVVPCTYTHSNPKNKITDWKGIWYIDSPYGIVYNKDSSKVDTRFRGRTSLLGELNKKNCSLHITNISQTDKGTYWFRIELQDHDSFSYSKNKVDVSVKADPDPPLVSGETKEVRVGENITISCSVSHSCPPHPPIVTWNHNGTTTVQSHPLTAGQHNLTSTLTFTASASDHQQPITCFAQHYGGKKVSSSQVTFSVKYTPVNVTVSPSAPSVLENGSIVLTCSANGNPPVQSYQWRSESGPLPSQGETLNLVNITRHISTISCMAINSEGEGTSRPVKISVEYPPKISEGSFCIRADSGTQCNCKVESNPPSHVQWLWNNRNESRDCIPTQNGSITVAMDLLPPSLHQIVCLARNKHGKAEKILHVHNAQFYVYLGLGVAAVCFLIFLGIRKCSRKHQQKEMRQNPVYNQQNLQQGNSCFTETEDVYANDEKKDGDEIYTNTLHGCNEELSDGIYANY